MANVRPVHLSVRGLDTDGVPRGVFILKYAPSYFPFKANLDRSPFALIVTRGR